LLASGSILALSVGAANAADLTMRPAYKAPPPVVAPVAWTWTGFYIGAHIGSAWGTKEWTLNFDEPDFGPFPLGQTQVNGFLGGPTAGFNYQVDRWVFGVEGQFSWADVKGSSGCNNFFFEGKAEFPAFGSLSCNAKVDWLATLAARVGWTIDHALLYVKGGGAWVHDKFAVNCAPIIEGCEGGPFISGPGTVWSGSRTRAGWMWGAGVEYAFTPNWSAKIEYDFMDFGTHRVNLGLNTANAECECDFLPVDINQRIHLVKAGVNYRFNWFGFGKAPVVANY
jgi:outer membrane immunogenic protein